MREIKTPPEVYTLAVDIERIAKVLRKDLEDNNIDQPGMVRLAENLKSGADKLLEIIRSYEK